MKTNKTVMAVLLISVLSGPGLFAGIPLKNELNQRVVDQYRVITGTVKWSDGTPQSAINVRVKGTNSGTLTDQDGKYSIVVPSGPQTLVFSYTGCDTQERSLVADAFVVDVQMVCE